MLLLSSPDAPSCHAEVARATSAASDLATDGVRHQRIHGWGCCFNELGWDALQILPPAARRHELRELWHPRGAIRLTIGRVPVGGNDYSRSWWSHDEIEGDWALRHVSTARDETVLIPYVRAAARELGRMPELFASPWSPPTWLKQPMAHNHGRVPDTARALGTWARLLATVLGRWRRLGMPVAHLHPQNEPIADQKFPSCVWDGPVMARFIADHLVPALRRAGDPCQVWLGTLNTDRFHDWCGPLLDPRLRSAIAGVGLQWAGRALAWRLHAAHPGLRLWQTEHECGDGANTWAHALHSFDLIHDYLSHGVEAYVWWNPVLGPGGVSTWGWRQNALITVDPATRRAIRNPEWHLLRQFTAAADPGAVRLGLAGPWSAQALAFANPDGSHALVVANPGRAQRLIVDLAGQRHVIRLPEAGYATLRV